MGRLPMPLLILEHLDSYLAMAECTGHHSCNVNRFLIGSVGCRVFGDLVRSNFDSSLESVMNLMVIKPQTGLEVFEKRCLMLKGLILHTHTGRQGEFMITHRFDQETILDPLRFQRNDRQNALLHTANGSTYRKHPRVLDTRDEMMATACRRILR